MNGGVWVAYYTDWSAVVFFEEEIQALRYAVEHEMKVQFMHFGTPIREQVGR